MLRVFVFKFNVKIRCIIHIDYLFEKNAGPAFMQILQYISEYSGVEKREGHRELQIIERNHSTSGKFATNPFSRSRSWRVYVCL
jgi:hypothetical protein